jgi:hypothetical protein
VRNRRQRTSHILPEEEDTFRAEGSSVAFGISFLLQSCVTSVEVVADFLKDARRIKSGYSWLLLLKLGTSQPDWPCQLLIVFNRLAFYNWPAGIFSMSLNNKCVVVKQNK